MRCLAALLLLFALSAAAMAAPDPQSGAAQPGASQSGALQSGASQSGASQSGASQSGASQSGASQSGASQSGASQSGASQSGVPQSGVSQSGGSQSCAAPPQFVTTGKSLGPLKAAIDGKRPVEILAIGSGSTTGSNGDQPDNAFPYRMLDALRAGLPQLTFNLTVLGGRGMSAEQMLPLVAAQVRQAPPQLVLWQTGTVEAIHAMRATGMRTALREGLDAIRKAGGSLVLIDPQFSRALRSNTDIEPYETELQLVGALPDAVLFHRYDLTRVWALQGQIDPERATTDTRQAVLVRLNACLGQALARFVLSGAGIASP